jgi:plastocyanin
MKYLWTAVVAIIVIAGVWYLVQGQQTVSENMPTPTGSAGPGVTNGADGSVDVSTTVVHEVVVNGSSFAFDPKEIRVPEGTRVRVVFNNQGGMHDFVIDEFNARTKVLPSGQSETIEFVANKKGSFEYYCSVGTHREMGMKGTLVVE